MILIGTAYSRSTLRVGVSTSTSKSVLDGVVHVDVCRRLFRLLDADVPSRPPHVTRSHLPETHAPVVPRRRENSSGVWNESVRALPHLAPN